MKLPVPISDAAYHARFLEAADRIGYALCRDAVWSEDRCNWLGWSTEPVGAAFTPVYRALTPSLYNGVSGVALFLATLWQFTRDRHQRTILNGAIRQIHSTRDTLDSPSLSGFYSGAAGVGWALMRVGEIVDDGQLIRCGITILAQLRGKPIPAGLFDILSGSAGVITALLDAASRHREPALIEIAVEHGKHLLQSAREDEHGTSWPSPLSERNLTGYSHGAAGIAVALLELHRVTGDGRFLAAGMSAIRYERSLFDKSADNWPDFRIDPANPHAGPRHVVAWCNGATGIGLSRLRVVELFPGDPEILPEIDAAMRSAIRALTMTYPEKTADFTPCHGITGHAEFLLEVALRFGRADLRQLVESAGENGLKTYHQNRLAWPCGVPGAGETPALLLGTSGIGHFYLRLFDAARVESILVLRPGRNGSDE